MDLQDKSILLGVTGGIAAYKSLELLRLFKKAKANVNVIMTDNALKFIGSVSFATLSENPVLLNLFDNKKVSINHIKLAQSSDIAIVAPASANTIAKFAYGIADNALSTTILAITCPVIICPAMNVNMYNNVKTKRNLDLLKQDGWSILNPDKGELACKSIGEGRLPEPWVIFDRTKAILTKKDLLNKKVLVSAGPTIEPIDPVRFISNYSSGKMGYEIAAAAEKRGAIVTLVSGPVHLDSPLGVKKVDVNSSEQMANAMLENLDQADIVFKVAAVTDYKPKTIENHKIKKDKKNLSILMTENPDILNLIKKKKKKDQFIVGFAAETKNLEQNALKKMNDKKLDMIAANKVGLANSGFNSNTNKIKLFFKNGFKVDIPLMQKEKIADIMIDNIIRYQKKI